MMKLYKNDVVMFSGDSITEGARVRKMDCNHVLGHGFQYTVAGELALEYAAEAPKFANKAYSGATMYQLFEKWNEDIIANKPTVINILAGVNDANCGFHQGKTPEEAAERYYNALKGAIELSKKELPEVRIIVCEPFYFPLDKTDLSMKFTPHYECEEHFNRPDTGETEEQMAYMTEAVSLIGKKARLAAEETGCYFVEFCECFEKAIENSRREYFTWDGTHPTVAGHALMARQWLKATANI